MPGIYHINTTENTKLMQEKGWFKLLKRKRWGLWLAIAAICAVICAAVCLSFCLYSPDACGSDFEKALADIENIEFVDMPSSRSELFPVAGRQDGWSWRIAQIEDDEIFYTAFTSPEEAQNCYWASIDKCKEGSLFLCGRDVIYYPGDSSDILLTLQQRLPDPRKQ